ncbi:MAG: hypothetical protein FRX49_08977 [Trebouxia sp. A1-2]|nr:MAG: hypothetical protein FRX49_08977 [Trebouxia sp. A1-2]
MAASTSSTDGPSWVQGKIAIVVKGLHKETDPSLAMLKKAKQGRVQQGAYGFSLPEGMAGP